MAIDPEVLVYIGYWLCAISDREHYDSTTTRYALTYLYRFLQLQPRTPYLQLIAITCFWMATKFHEDDHIMEIRTIKWYTKDEYDSAGIIRMESFICATLQWNLHIPLLNSQLCRTPHIMEVFLHRCALVAAIPYSSDIISVSIHVIVHNHAIKHFFMYGTIADCIRALTPYEAQGAAYNYHIYNLYTQCGLAPTVIATPICTGHCAARITDMEMAVAIACKK